MLLNEILPTAHVISQYFVMIHDLCTSIGDKGLIGVEFELSVYQLLWLQSMAFIHSINHIKG